jgi:hypothetical protein
MSFAILLLLADCCRPEASYVSLAVQTYPSAKTSNVTETLGQTDPARTALWRGYCIEREQETILWGC